LVLFGEGSLKRAVAEYVEHYSECPHLQREHVPISKQNHSQPERRIGRKQRLGGLLNYYKRAA